MLTTRRLFLQGMGAACALAAPPLSFEYAGSRDSIEVFRIQRGRRIRIQTLPSQNPSFVTLNASRNLLFAVNEISEYQTLPTGAVESYSVQPGNGQLKFISRAPLALSATLPRHLAVSPDSRHLVVAAFGGGSYNVLPIGDRGELGPVTQVIKEIGRGIHPIQQTCAHPHSVVFHPSGKFVIGTDFGSDRINVFAFESGRLTRLRQLEVAPGSRPAHLEINEEGTSLFVRYDLDSATARYSFHTASGHLTKL